MVAAIAAYFGILAIVVLVIVGLSVVVHWKIAAKAGYNPALSLLMLVPGANLIVQCIFAFSEWPVERELKRARGEAGPPQWTPPAAPPPGPPPPATYLPPAT